MNEILKKPYKITLWEDRNVYITRQSQKGDVNFDGVIDSKDYLTLSKYLNHEDVEIDKWAADIDNNNIIDNSDLSLIDSSNKRQELINNPILKPSERKTILSENDLVQNQYLEEVCVATIGSDTMDTPIRVFNPILTEELNGSRTLTFQIYYRYWDDDSEDFKLNPFINLLVNERKVKLKYNDEWYDFVIKQVQEDSESKVFTYNCSDLFINELGKTGYEVELDTELQNNMGTIQELSATILEGTDWSEKDSDHLIQRNKELLYSYVLPNAISATDMKDKDKEIITIPAGEVIYIFYSCKVKNEMPVQFLYVPSNGESTYDEALLRYKIDKDGFITNSKNWQTSNPIDYSNLRHSSYFGEKIVEKQKSKFIPEIGETCTVWSKNNQQYYCYTELEYASVAEIQNMLVNGANFITVNGWTAEGSGNSVTLSTYTPTNGSTTYRTISVSGTVTNKGFFANRAALAPKGFVKGESYTFIVKAGGSNNISSAQVKVKDNGGTENTILNFSSSTSGSGILSGYKKFTATCNTSINYQSLVNDYLDIIFVLTSNSSTNIIDAKAFLNRYDSNGDLIVPDLQATTNSIVKTRYNFFPVNTNFNTVYGKDSLTLTETLENTAGYTPVMIEGYEKVTSITGSKSNRFNLIQSLCEAFECWAKFSIEHNENTGKILYDYVPLTQDEYIEGGRYYTYIGNGNNPQESSIDIDFQIYSGNTYQSGLYKKVYHKYVTFKEFIGQDNIVGFRYGINLKSIQRDVVSDQIASKVIVQANTNEFAPNGSCTIQQAVLNPTGENALYNFQYFINHGLLDVTALYDDLYGENGGLGFYPNMRALNDSITEPIQELALLSNTITTLESRQTVYNALLEEADNLKANISAELNANGYGISGGSNVPDYISNLRKNYESYDTTAGYYTSVSASNNSLLNSYRSQYEGLSSQLKEVLAKKNKLNSDFHNKYYKFIQEGTWTSNDYYDPELYYQAANMVLYTSSFPQTSYTINVLELSQLEGYEPYTFKIADKTYIEDTEFFGYDYKNRPYKEEIVVSEVKYSLDDPTQNTITVQNYKTQFQDLFQRIAAASQSLQYNEGAYNRAASAINDNGTINTALLQNSLKDNELIIQNAKNQSVTWDETGITISNFVNANEIVRLTSGGIVLSSDGGQSWTTGITGTGINADVITTGRLDTNRIRIFNNNMQTFEWNSKGINAFAQTTTGNVTQTDFSKFVRFDQYGLYGYSGSANWDPEVETNNVVGINKVIRDSIFSLTWKGLSINVPSSQTEPVITIGNSNNPTFQIRANGDVTLAGNITWGESSQPTTTKVLYAASKLNIPDPNTNYGENNSQIIKIEQVNATSINTENGWKKNLSITSPDTNYDGVYQSTNQGIASSYSVAKITFRGFTTFKVYIRSNAESTFDYTIASILDPTGIPTSATSNNTKAHTSGNQQSGNLLSNYTEVTYDNISSGIHNIYIIYRKDNSNDINDDSGYFLIPKSANMVWHTTFDPTFDTYASYSYDNGNTWTSPISVSIDSQSVYNALVQNNNGKMGIFYIKSSDATAGGQLYINADYIKAGSITADRIHGGTLSGITLNINDKFKVSSTGALTIGDNFSVSNTGVIEAKSGYFDDNVYLGTLGNGKRGSISTILNRIAAAVSDAEDAAEDAQNAVDAVAAKLDKQSSGYGGIDYYSGSGTQTSGKGIKMYADSVTYITATANGVSMRYDADHQLYILSDGSHFLGTVYQGSTTIHSSDQKIKKDIEYNLDNYENFILNLKPCRFKFIDGESGRYHLGFIAQDIEDNLIKNDLLSTEFAGWCKWKDTSNNSSKIERQGLRYEEFIALNTYMIQKLESRIKTLENLLSS